MNCSLQALHLSRNSFGCWPHFSNRMVFIESNFVWAMPLFLLTALPHNINCIWIAERQLENSKFVADEKKKLFMLDEAVDDFLCYIDWFKWKGSVIFEFRQVFRIFLALNHCCAMSGPHSFKLDMVIICIYCDLPATFSLLSIIIRLILCYKQKYE